MKLVHWLLMGGLLLFDTARRDLVRVTARLGPCLLYQCNSLPINGWCTNQHIAVYWYVALHFSVPIKGLIIRTLIVETFLLTVHCCVSTVYFSLCYCSIVLWVLFDTRNG